MSIKFVVDEMNGDIARWLRIIGFDTLYLKGENLDEQLLKIAIDEDRILLTSDKVLYQKAVRMNIKAVYTGGKDLREKLTKIATSLNLHSYVREIREYRCPICNTVLTEVDHFKRHSISIKLPDCTPLYMCPSCKKLYWKGSHWKNITNFLKEIGLI
ncbi:MAG: Mut7-C RNAse domain-containing protein [Candidatus Geothermarchaeota archaeon]